MEAPVSRVKDSKIPRQVSKMSFPGQWEHSPAFTARQLNGTHGKCDSQEKVPTVGGEIRGKCYS